MEKGRSPYRACGPFLCLLLLCGCGNSTQPTGEESRQLDNAAEMLNAADAELNSIDRNLLPDEPVETGFPGEDGNSLER